MTWYLKALSHRSPFAFAILLLGCNSILGIQKATSSEDPTAECNLKLDDRLVDGCIFRASCDPISPPFNLSNCVTYRSQAVFPEEQGTLNATSCAAIEQNVGRRYEPPSSCSSGQDGWACSGDGRVARYCGDGRPFIRDCDVRGSVCTVEASAASGAYPCGLPDHISCANNEDKSTFCEGSLQLGCTDGRAVGYDCETVDTKCFETPSGATCLPDGGNCPTVGEITCQDDSKVDYCADPGVLIHYECSDGTKCENGDRGVDCYVDDCTPEAGCEEGCADDGVTLEFCVAGAKVTRDCTDYGFDFCSSYESADKTTTFAYCMMDKNKPFPGTTADWGEEPESSGSGGSGTSGTGGSGPNPGTGGQGNEEIYCYATEPVEGGYRRVCAGQDDEIIYCYANAPGDSPICSSVDYCVSDSGCFFLVNGSMRIAESCEELGAGRDQVQDLCFP